MYSLFAAQLDTAILLPNYVRILCLFLGLTTTFEILHREFDWQKGFIAYEVKAVLRSKKAGEVIAKGVGCCNSKERKYKNKDAADISNTILKMAKKRGQAARWMPP